MVKINGREIDAAGKSVADFIADSDYSSSRIAVEINGEIVPKADHGTTVLADGDNVEIVSFVGGG